MGSRKGICSGVKQRSYEEWHTVVDASTNLAPVGGCNTTPRLLLSWDAAPVAEMAPCQGGMVDCAVSSPAGGLGRPSEIINNRTIMSPFRIVHALRPTHLSVSQRGADIQVLSNFDRCRHLFAKLEAGSVTPKAYATPRGLLLHLYFSGLFLRLSLEPYARRICSSCCRKRSWDACLPSRALICPDKLRQSP